MTLPVQSPNSYLDFAGLGRLRGQARADSDGAARATAQQFEAMFIQMMMKSMREASPKSEFLQSQSMDSYQELYDKELSMTLAKRGTLGIADMLTKQMTRSQAAPLEPEKMSKPIGMVQSSVQSLLPGLPLHPPVPTLPLHKAAPTFVLPKPPEPGLPLSRVPQIGPAQDQAPAE